MVKSAKRRAQRYRAKLDPHVVPKRLAQVYELSVQNYYSESTLQAIAQTLAALEDLPIFVRKKVYNYMTSVIYGLTEFQGITSYNIISLLADRYTSLPPLARITIDQLIKSYEPLCAPAFWDRSYWDLSRYGSYIGETGIYSYSNYDNCVYG